jgi:hypothetical protein
MFQFIKKRKLGATSVPVPEMEDIKSDTEELLMKGHSSMMEQLNPLVLE